MTVWIDDGIIYMKSKGIPSTSESVIQTLAVIHDLADGSRRPTLFDARNWPKTDGKVWATAMFNLRADISAGAFLVDPDSPIDLGRWPETVDQMVIPTQVFTDEAEALKFLRSVADSGSNE